MQIRRRRRGRGRWWASRWTWAVSFFQGCFRGEGLRREGFAKDVNRLLDRGGAGGGAAQGVEHHEVVQGGVVANQGRAHAGLDELAAVRLTLVTEDVVLIDDEEGLGQTLELVDRCAQR